MQTRNQKSIKFSVFTNALVFFHGSVWACVYVVCIWSAAQFPFAFIYLLSLCGPGLAFCAHCTLALGASQSIEFWSVSECEWIQSSTFLLSKVQVQSQGLCGGGGVMEWAAVSPCHPGLMDHGDQPVLHCTMDIQADISRIFSRMLWRPTWWSPWQCMEVFGHMCFCWGKELRFVNSNLNLGP